MRTQGRNAERERGTLERNSGTLEWESGTLERELSVMSEAGDSYERFYTIHEIHPDR